MRWSEGGTVVEVAAAFGLPFPPSAVVTMTTFGVRSTLVGGEPEAGPDLE